MTSRHGPGGRAVDGLRRLLAARSILVMPTAHDPVSAWLAEMAGFEALVVSRGAVAMAARASADPEAAEDELVVGRVAEICRLVSVPVLVDLTPTATRPDRIRDTATALATSGAAGLVLDDRGDPDSVVGAAELEARLLTAREALERRGLELVTVARTFVLPHGGATAALERLTGLRGGQELGIVDGLAAADLAPGVAAWDAVPLLFLDGREKGDEALVPLAERAGFRAYAWSTPLIQAAVDGMRRRLAGAEE